MKGSMSHLGVWVHTGGDSPEKLAPGVRHYTIHIGKSPPIPGRGGVGHFIDTRISVYAYFIIEVRKLLFHFLLYNNNNSVKY